MRQGKACVAELFPHGEPRMQTLEELQKEMEHVSLEPWSVWDKINFPEKRKAVEDRVRSTCKKILERHKDENILFVGHGLSVHHVVSSLPGSRYRIVYMHFRQRWFEDRLRFA